MRTTVSHHLPDSPFADFHLRAASMADAAALAALLQQLAPPEPRGDAKLLALRLGELPASCRQAAGKPRSTGSRARWQIARHVYRQPD